MEAHEADCALSSGEGSTLEGDRNGMFDCVLYLAINLSMPSLLIVGVSATNWTRGRRAGGRQAH